MNHYIEFPNLWGLKFELSNVAIQIFSFEIYWYGLILAFAMFLSLTLANKDCEKFDVSKDHLYEAVLIAVPSAIVCARLYYVIFKIHDYQSLMDVINIRQGGLAIYGGVIGAALSTYLYTRYRKINFWKFIDYFAPFIVLGQAIGRWGNFFNQEAFGYNTNLPWGMTGNVIKANLQYLANQGFLIDPSGLVHPTFLYESVWNFMIFGFLIFYRKKKKVDGEIFALYMILYGFGRAFIESLRTDSLYIGQVRVSMLLGIVLFLVFTAFIIFKRRKNKIVSTEHLTKG